MKSQYGLIVVVAIVVAACNTEGSPNRATIVHDSAGIRIVEIRNDIWKSGESWQLSPEPLLEIGVEEGDSVYELYEVSGARRVGDGGIAVVNSGTNEVRFFDRDGRYRRSIGRSGEGPGEFRGLLWLQVLPGDTLVTLDVDLYRITAFTYEGDVAWTRPFPLHANGMHWEQPVDIRTANGGFIILGEEGTSALARVRAGTLRVGETVRQPSFLLRYTDTGELIETVDTFPGIEKAVFERNGRPSSIFPPLGRLVSHTLAQDRIYVGTQDRWEIREYTLDGTLVGLIRRPGVDLSIDVADVERYMAQLLAFSDDPAERRAFAEDFSSVPLPDGQPAYGRLLADSDGKLWISQAFNSLAETPTRWSVYDPQVGMLGDVVVPERFDVYEIGPDYILGRWTDQVGVEYVRLYGLARN